MGMTDFQQTSYIGPNISEALTSPSQIQTFMGWNQVVQVVNTSNISSDLISLANGGKAILRVQDYSMGSKQQSTAPDLITGATDRTAYHKGPVTIDGTLKYPLTIESGNGTVSGFSFFTVGALLSKKPTMAFDLQGAGGEIIGGCKANKVSIGCESEKPVECDMEVWGVSTSHSNISQGGPVISTEDINDPPFTDVLATTGYGPVTQDYGGSDLVNGVDVSGKLSLVQIPMWDACWVEGVPDGMFVKGFKIDISNELKRFYTMGNNMGASPYGLNATSLGAGQRKITGTLSWQSDASGKLKAIIGAGIRKVRIYIKGVGGIEMKNCVWDAKPPTISTGDRVTCETSFQALGDTGIFDAIVLLDANGNEITV